MINFFKFRGIWKILFKKNSLLLRLKTKSKDTLATGLHLIVMCIQMFHHCCTLLWFLSYQLGYYYCTRTIVWFNLRNEADRIINTETSIEIPLRYLDYFLLTRTSVIKDKD
jgi:hypothetical protein